jgi:hypothetical protein
MIIPPDFAIQSFSTLLCVSKYSFVTSSGLMVVAEQSRPTDEQVNEVCMIWIGH